MEYLILGIVTVGIGGIFWLLLTKKDAAGANNLVEENAKLKAELSQTLTELGKSQQALAAEKADAQEKQGKGKQLFAEHTKLEGKFEALQKERDQLAKRLSQYEESEERREQEKEMTLQRLTQAEQRLDETNKRLLREDEERRIQMEADRDRVWAEHEVNVIAQLTSFCKHPSFAFSHFTNTQLPDGFDGSLKPDFMIEFLGQYIIFDAKASKAESLQTYINNTIKKTVEKIKKYEKIASTLFLVVPTQAIAELKTHHYPLEGYNIYVISPESIGPILASLKKITTYELAEQLDPQKRENLINLLAEMDFQITLQNAANLFLTQSGINVLEKTKKVDPQLWEEAQQKKEEMKIPTFSELKKMVGSMEVQQEIITNLVSPKIAIKPQDIDRAKRAITQQLL